MIEEPKYEVLRTYNKIWDVPFKIYSIDRMRLIIPINPWDVIYYAVGLSIGFILDFIYPGDMLFIYKYIVIPLLIRFLLTKVKLDGKKPHKFFWGMAKYFLMNKKKEHFIPIQDKELNITFDDISIIRATGELKK